MDRHFSNADRHPDSIHLKLQPICQRIQDEYLQALDPTAGDHEQAHPGTTIVLITYAVIMMQKKQLLLQGDTDLVWRHLYRSLTRELWLEAKLHHRDNTQE